MKKLCLFLMILSVVFITVSCNLDNEEGLFQEAGNSSRHENYSNYNIIGKGADGLMIASDMGVYEYGKANYFGTGVIARNALFADSDHVVFYNDGSQKTDEAGFYVYTRSTDSMAPLSNTNLDGYVLSGSPYSTDGEHFSLVFRKQTSESTYDFKIAYASLTSVSDVESLAPTSVDVSATGKDIKGVTIVGADKFIATLQTPGSKMNRDAVYYVISSLSIDFSTPAERYYWGVTGDVTIDYQGQIKYNDKPWSTEINITNRVAMFDDTASNKVIIIPSSSSNVYVLNKNTEKLEIVAIPGLNSLYVLSVINVDTDGCYTVMTASSGLKKIDLEKELIK